MSRGLANCNPGNIRQSKVRYKGEVRPSRDPAFKQFESLAWGYRAIFVLLHTYRVRHGLRSIREMISRWAPPSENRTEAYIRAVSADTGIGPDEALETLDPATMVPVAASISRVENGVADLALHEDQHHFLFRLDRDVEEFLGFLVRCSAGVDYCSSACPRGLRGVHHRLAEAVVHYADYHFVGVFHFVPTPCLLLLRKR